MLKLSVIQSHNFSINGLTIFFTVDITFVNAPENQYPVAGRDYIVNCEVQADPSPIISWQRNGEPINSEGRYVVDSKGLLIKNIKESDDGVYTCRAVVVTTGHLQTRNIKVIFFTCVVNLNFLMLLIRLKFKCLQK